MSILNPGLNQGAELPSALEKFRRFGGCGNLDAGVVNHIALSTASIEKQHKLISLFPECKARAFEAESVMSWNSRDTVSRRSRRHSCHLQSCVVGGGEPTALRKRRESGISQVSSDYGAKLIKFLFARLAYSRRARFSIPGDDLSRAIPEVMGITRQ
jgi:hypothetical protein